MAFVSYTFSVHAYLCGSVYNNRITSHYIQLDILCNHPVSSSFTAFPRELRFCVTTGKIASSLQKNLYRLDLLFASTRVAAVLFLRPKQKQLACAWLAPHEYARHLAEPGAASFHTAFGQQQPELRCERIRLSWLTPAGAHTLCSDYHQHNSVLCRPGTSTSWVALTVGCIDGVEHYEHCRLNTAAIAPACNYTGSHSSAAVFAAGCSEMI